MESQPSSDKTVKTISLLPRLPAGKLFCYVAVPMSCAAAVSAVSIIIAILEYGDIPVTRRLAAAWSILPPLYFAAEYIMLDAKNAAESADLARGQDYASKIWAGLTVAMFFLLKG